MMLQVCIEHGMLIGYLTLPYPILSYLDYMLYHTIFPYLTLILPLSYPYPTISNPDPYI
jgi:hypothetical protein